MERMMTDNRAQPDRSQIRELLRQLPSVERLLSLPVTMNLVDQYGRPLTVEALRATLDEQRETIQTGRAEWVPMNAMLVDAADTWLQALVAPTLKPVINGTGVIIHTNLGRAPLSEAAVAAINEIAAVYGTLEYELDGGRRGSRTVHAAELLTRLTGAEAALVVNNNAAAVLLMLTGLCQGREVVISRGQLVEIGGGFRIPDVMAQSGARLVEVGTTNRTHLRDYEAAINENTAALLVAHHSNYKVIGFTAEPSLAELAQLAHKYQLPLLYDQGSGALLDTAAYGLDPEPTVVEALSAGCDLVAFSGDKLLGGPQAGILTGSADLVRQLKRHPLARAIRADKLCLAALAATLTPYLTGRATAEVPVWRMIARPLVEIEAEVTAWVEQLHAQAVAASMIDGLSTVGGGSLPGTSLPTKLLAIDSDDPDRLAADLRRHQPPIIGRISDGRYLIDPRTVLAGQAETLLQALRGQARRRGENGKE